MMFHRIPLALPFGVALLLGPGWFSATVAPAQDFTISTNVHDVSGKEAKELMHGVTLFHAGKTYDFLQDLGELIVFDPARGKFTLVNTRQRRAAEAHLDEIRQMLKMARQTLNDDVRMLQGSNKPGAQTTIDQILFQFNPQFEERLSQINGQPRLDLSSHLFEYHVQCAPPPTPQHGDANLNYADWICRLNYVLHPSSILPEQRIVLNASLRKSGLIPVEVLFVDVTHGVRLRAQHRIFWELNDHDRELLRQWDALLVDRSVKRVSFQEYQRSLLLSQVSRRR